MKRIAIDLRHLEATIMARLADTEPVADMLFAMPTKKNVKKW